MIKKIPTCDICGSERKEANHWFVAYTTKVGLHLHTWKWSIDNGNLENEEMRHLCGQKCVHSFVDSFLSSSTSSADSSALS